MQPGQEFKIPPQLRALESPHRATLEAVFGPLRPAPEAVATTQNVLFLCFSNRCGSNYLAHLLASTGQFNEAGEFFNADTVLEHALPRNVRSLAGYFTALAGLLPHFGHFAMKTGVDQLVMLADAGVLSALGNRARFLLLERQDRLGQAISRVIAMQTGRFLSYQQAAVPDHELRYARAAVDAELAKIAQSNGLFYLLFAANGIVPIHTTYEAILADAAPVLGQIAEAMGTGPLTAHPEALQLERQANAVNAQWRRLYEGGR